MKKEKAHQSFSHYTCQHELWTPNGAGVRVHVCGMSKKGFPTAITVNVVLCSLAQFFLGRLKSLCVYLCGTDPGVFLLKGPIDRPEAWAFPVNLLLTELIGPLGRSCQQPPTPPLPFHPILRR